MVVIVVDYISALLPHCLICYPTSIALIKPILKSRFQLLCCGNGSPNTLTGLHSFVIGQGVSTDLGPIMKYNT